MGSKTFNSFSLLSLAILGAILLSQGVVEARGRVGVSPFCKNARFLTLCNRMVGGATNTKDASLNALKLTRALATRLPALTIAVTDIVNTIGISPEEKDTVIRQCTGVLDSAIDDLDRSVAAVEAGDAFTAAVRLSAIGFSDCSDAMEEFGVTFPMNKVVVQFERHISNCLAIVQA